MKANKTVTVKELRRMLVEKEPVYILDVRPEEQREEWKIPGSHHIDAYDQLKQGNESVLDDVHIPNSTKVITVCAAGKTSEMAAETLNKKGIDAYSLEGGMKAWSLAWNTAELIEGELKIIQVRRTGKGCLSYVIGSDKEALVIDASLDPEIYVGIAEENGWNIKYILDTHVHADHLSRSLQLSELTAGALYMPDQDKLMYSFNKIVDGKKLEFGSSNLKAMHTPGHTIESTSYLINNKYLLTGDTLFTDGVGRPDLKASEEEISKRASLLYDSLKKIMNMNDQVFILPGHISKPVEFDSKIIGAFIKDIKVNITSLQLPKEEFIKTIISKIPPTPPNFLKVVELNITGDFSSVDPKEVEAGANRCAIS